ncbi:MAG: L,D-transpeptidase family protein, partial [Methylococcales bacterium]
ECLKELSRGADLSGPPIDKIVVYKKKRRMYTYSKGKLINEFRISLGKNCDKGNKVQAGDYRTPEGSYQIVRKKCDNRLYKSLMISYPNANDKARASKAVVMTELAALKVSSKRLTAYTKAIAAADKTINKPAKKRRKRKITK